MITNTKTHELDYEGAPTTDEYVYEGTGGIPIGNVLQRALFAWRFRDVNLLISGQITADSRIMIYRDIQARVPKAVPFLTFDSDPYLAIVEGRLVWIWDAYTTTDQYPYSESVNLSEATDGLLPGSTGDVNYIRNSVKVVVDAYDGTMTYYADLDGDPIVQVWARAFPDLFTDDRTAPQELQRALPVPGEPLPGAGDAVRELPRDRPAGLLSEAGLLGRSRQTRRTAQDGDRRRHGGRSTPQDPPLLPADEDAGRQPTERFQLVLPVRARRAGRTWWRGWPRTPTPRPTGSCVAFTFPVGAERRRARRRSSRGSTRTRSSPRSGRCWARADRPCCSATCW